MSCPYADYPAACIAAMQSDGYLLHDPIKRPWAQYRHDNCPLRAERIASIPHPKRELPPDDERGEPIDTVCTKCGKPLCEGIQRGHQKRNTGLCLSCYRVARKQPDTCRHYGCVNKARRGGYCRKHQEDRKCNAQNAA